MKVPCKSSRAGGAPPRTDALIGPAACGRCPKPDSLKQRAVCALSLSWISWLSGTPRSYASCFRNCALQRAPVRWTLALKPTIWRSPRPCQSVTSQSNEFNACRWDGAFPWRHAAVPAIQRVSNREPPEETRTDQVIPETKNRVNTLNSREN